jgi:hypothetical protein
MNYSELVQIYFERSTAMQNYWNLYVLVVGGLLAFSSLRKHHAAITTALVCLLFALFAHENLGALKDVTAQRFALLDAIKRLGPGNATDPRPIRERLEPTLTPATYSSVRVTHVTSDILTIAASIAMELRRRKFGELQPVS